MITTLLHLLRLVPFLCGGHRPLALENLALRQQLAVYKRTASRPRVHRSDRLFWAWLSRVWTGWRACLWPRSIGAHSAPVGSHSRTRRGQTGAKQGLGSLRVTLAEGSSQCVENL